jgi:hypothetical protein
MSAGWNECQRDGMNVSGNGMNVSGNGIRLTPVAAWTHQRFEDHRGRWMSGVEGAGGAPQRPPVAAAGSSRLALEQQ